MLGEGLCCRVYMLTPSHRVFDVYLCHSFGGSLSSAGPLARLELASPSGSPSASSLWPERDWVSRSSVEGGMMVSSAPPWISTSSSSRSLYNWSSSVSSTPWGGVPSVWVLAGLKGGCVAEPGVWWSFLVGVGGVAEGLGGWSWSLGGVRLLSEAVAGLGGSGLMGGMGGGGSCLGVPATRARFSAFYAASACLSFSASACLSFSASLRVPSCCLALAAFALASAACCCRIFWSAAAVASRGTAAAFPLSAAPPCRAPEPEPAPGDAEFGGICAVYCVRGGFCLGLFWPGALAGGDSSVSAAICCS